MAWFGKETDSKDASTNLMSEENPQTPKHGTPIKAGTRTQSEQVLPNAREPFRQPSFMVSLRSDISTVI